MEERTEHTAVERARDERHEPNHCQGPAHGSAGPCPRGDQDQACADPCGTADAAIGDSYDHARCNTSESGGHSAPCHKGAMVPNWTRERRPGAPQAVGSPGRVRCSGESHGEEVAIERQHRAYTPDTIACPRGCSAHLPTSPCGREVRGSASGLRDPSPTFLEHTRNGVEIHGSFTGPEPEVHAGRVGISHGAGPSGRFELQRGGDVGKAADLRDLCGAPSGSREVRRVDLRRLACRVPRRRRSTGRCGLGAEAACTGLTCPYALRQQKKRQGQDGQGVVALAFDPSDRCDTNPLPANARRHDCPPANADAFSR